ncbi:non-ribosomal peptide synthetase [Nocardioides zeae]|uniref:Amino acid adenylation domain-containing protein n=1 Tax=Nocardioides zeae TaxID=1457234 RepID=A0AAJ1U057_9ACTN|nr:non-ribosomal peptide synthetase [Nocardioides zeae]MDQ1102853.1 amino acid adenylation domain-containing protein [Nocardioides zeae]
MSGTWLSPARENAGARLICFPYAGGSGSAFRQWTRDLATDSLLVTATLLDRLDHWGSTLPDKVAYRFLPDGESEVGTLTYAELRDEVDALAAGLAAYVTARDRVVVLFTPSLDFVVSFLAVLRAGCTAVPVAPPAGAEALDTVGAILNDAKPRLVLTNLPDESFGGWASACCPIVSMSDVLSRCDGAAPSLGVHPSPHDVAFLQYTSGSTGRPRGVVVSHANLVSNQEQMKELFGSGEDAVVVSWLPQFHDMGLIGGVLHPLYLGGAAVIMPPQAFLRRPARWLEAISRYRGSMSPAPNFAYDLCARRVSDAEFARLDLSSWTIAFNGSEPVVPAVVAAFQQRFGPVGFGNTSFAPCYGLAEATLLVSGSVGLPVHVDGVVSCGTPVSRVIAVRDGRMCEEGEEGELWIQGANVACGYWGDDAATEGTFGARLPGEPDPFLATGDLGRLSNGELFVTGRLKDLIIMRGRNHHPQDIEQTVISVSSRFVAGSGAAFSVGQPERLILVQAIRGSAAGGDALDLADLTAKVRRAVSVRHGVTPSEVFLVRPGGVPRTTSGKVRRNECRQRYLAGRLPVVHQDLESAPSAGGLGDADSQPDRASEERIAGLVAEIMELAPGQLQEGVPLDVQGMDSLRAMAVQQLLVEECGIDPGLELIFSGPTLRELLALAPSAGIVRHGSSAESPPTTVTRGQQALWWLSQWNDGAARAYLISRAIDLMHDVTDERLRDAVTAVVDRHPQLRSRFEHDGTRLTRGEWAVAGHSWFEVVEVGDDEIDDALREHAVRVPDLSKDPLFRIVLFRRAKALPVLLVVASHTVTDLHSFGVVLDDLGALLGGLPVPGTAGYDSAATTAADESAYLASPQGRRDTEAWLDELRGVLDVDLPRDRSRGVGTRLEGDTLLLEFEAGSVPALDAAARQLRTSRFAVLFAAYHAWLERLSGQDDIVIGVPIALRAAPGSARSVGYLINTAPIRVSGSGDRSVADRVRRASSAVRAALGRANVPLALLVERLGLASDPSPLFQVSCGFYDDAAPGQEQLAGLALEVPGAAVRIGPLEGMTRPLPCNSAVSDLDVTFGVVDSRLFVRINYSSEAFDETTAVQLAESLQTLVGSALRDPDADLEELPMTSGGGSVLIPDALEVPQESLAALFLRASTAFPDEPAVVYGEQVLTYSELAYRTEEAGRAVLSRTVSPGADSAPLRRRGVVAVFAEGSPCFVVGMLGALRAGHAFLPVSPDLPSSRVVFLFDDAEVDVAFALADQAERLRSMVAACANPVEVVAVDEDGRVVGEDLASSQTLPLRQVDDLAYVVYTSGTTGHPKGVMIRDRNVLPLLWWQHHTFGAGPGMRMAQTCALSFDVGLQELLTVLMFGGAICIPLPAERYSSDDYGAFLARDRANAMYATPTFVRDLIARRVPMPTIEVIQIAGELLTGAVVRGVRPLFAPRCRIFNGYGPTETAINCAMHLTSDTATEGALPVGTPTGLAHLYVLDPQQRPLPIGMAGEVYIGGPGVGPGYVNRPEETATRFVPNVVSGEGAMYRTGDRGRVLADGTLMILGRFDDQLKLRGYRVEPLEVEAQIRALGTDCVVVVDRPASGAPRLLAFVSGGELDPGQIHLALSERLPHYMLPSSISAVESLPRTRNGKLDTARLVSQPSMDATGAPRPMVAVLSEVWSSLLGRPVEDIDANFFEIGGSSLVLAQAAVAVRQSTGLDVAVPRFFQYPTVRTMAAHLEQLSADTTPTTSQLARPRRARGRQRQR